MGNELNNNSFKNSCLDLCHKRFFKISTGHDSLDKHFGGGISLGQVIELIGNSGTGKTRMCLQLCLNVQIPKALGGPEGQALFLDTRQDFHPNRLQELACQLEQQYEHTCSDFKALKMLQNVYHVSCPSAAHLMANVLNCHSYLKVHPNIKLIVIDSLAFSLRMLDDVSQRHELLLELHESMRQLLQQNQVAWVVTNVLTHHYTNGEYSVEPALGEMHSYLINERVWFTQMKQCYSGKTASTSRLIGNL